MNRPSCEFEIIQVDVDECGELAQQQGIEAMPTFQLFKNGEKIGQLRGANKAKLHELVQANI